MTKKDLENSVVSLASMTAGAMASRIIADKLPIKDKKLKRGLLIATGILSASSLDRKSTGKKIGQDMAISIAVTQTGELIKEIVQSKLKKDEPLPIALGYPIDSLNEPMLLDSEEFLGNYTSLNYDSIAEDIIEDSEEFAG